MKRLSVPALAVLCILFLSGCLELIRRSGSPAGASSPAAAGGRPSAPAGKDSAGGMDAARPSSRRTEPKGRGSAGDRDRAQRTRQTNEYALWCIDHSMWNEARSHLERALAQDSLSASLHNNLAIVYEHFGLVDKAAEFYKRARKLKPGNEHYEANLQRLEKGQQAAEDTTGQIDIFDLKQRIPGPRGDPYQRPQPLFKGE